MPNVYCIKNDYKINPSPKYWDDTSMKDEYQKEVYEVASTLFENNGFESVVDLGTGSGFKLLKHFYNAKTIGIDVESTVKWLKLKYPTRRWECFTNELYINNDLFICADTIEHAVCPESLMDYILCCEPKLIVLSTPDRSRLNAPQEGPPLNPCHVREWTMPEFYSFVTKYFKVVEHFISNEKQATQCLVAKLKK